MAYHPGRHFLQIPGPTNFPGARLTEKLAAFQPTFKGRKAPGA